MIDCVVAPVDQTFPVADEEVNVMLAPGQKPEGPVITGVAGTGFAVTMNAADVAEQPLMSVTVTEYEPAAETVIDGVVAPVDQRFPVAADDVRVAEVPAQNEAGPLTVGVGTAVLVATILAADVAEQPAASVTVTVNEPAADTVIDCVAAPVDQRFPVAEDEVRVIVPPPQMLAGPLMVGAAVPEVTVTGTSLETTAPPQVGVVVQTRR